MAGKRVRLGKTRMKAAAILSETETTIGAALLAAEARWPDAPAFDDGAHRLTWQALTDRAARAGAALRRLGIGKGDRFAIWLPNSLGWVEAGLGAALIGAVMVPINTRLKPPEAAYMLQKSAATVLLTTGDFLGVDYVAAARTIDAPALQTVVSAAADGGPSEWSGLLDAATDVEIAAVRAGAADIRPDDVVEVMFTSGTTGFPKGAVIRHGQIARAYSIYAERAGIGPGDPYLIVAPMFHSFGWKAGVVVSVLSGAVMRPVAVFDVEEALQIVAEEKIAVMGGPPTIFITLLELAKERGRDISSLKSIVLGGAIIPPALVRALREESGVDVVLSAYGLTETTALVTMAYPSDTIEQIATTSGPVVPGMEMRTVDAEGRETLRGEPGEILARGPHVMSGYFEDPERTVETFTEDGWLRTGDIGVIDEAGYLAITDRAKDMILVGGFNVYPAEVEAVIQTHPAVQAAAVIGIPDARMGEVAKAFLELRPGAAVEPGEFIAWCRERMANFKAPRTVEFIPALPRNAMGKVQKFLLREA